MKEKYSSKFAIITDPGLNLIYTSIDGDIVHSLFLCNKASSSTTVSLAIERGTQTFFILKNYKIPKNTTYSIDKAINLIPGDIILVSGETLNAIDVSLGLLQFLPVYGENYTSYGVNIASSSWHLIYQCPENTTSNIHSFYIANVNDPSIAKVSIWIVDQNNDYYHLLKDTEIEPTATIVWNKPINLKANEAIYASSSNNRRSDALISMLELLNE
jgi:hypothetical protein